jgi:hypothetical protein
MKRTSVYMFFVVLGFWLLTLAFPSCKSQHKPDDAMTTSEIIVKMLIFEPYCQGAAPEPGSEYQRYIPHRNETYFIQIYNDIQIATVDTTLDPIPGFFVQTNDSGFLHLQLKPGKYGIKLALKGKPFKEFYQSCLALMDNNNIRHLDRDCYVNWWNTSERYFEVPANISGKSRIWLPPVSIHKQCFTGVNPCLIYDGPMPP